MLFFERQIKGMIAISIALAIIPFLIFISNSKINYQIPELSDQFPEKIAVEIVEDGKSRGIYFVAPDTSVNWLLKSIDIEYQAKENILLDNRMKIKIGSVSADQNITVTEIESAKQLALGMPLNINLATESDLLLVTGIGEVTAKNILDLRSKFGRYENIEQLTQIKGIKGKKLAKLRKYLYVEN